MFGSGVFSKCIMAEFEKNIIKYEVLYWDHNRLDTVGCRALCRARWLKLVEIDLCNFRFNKQIIYWERNPVNIWFELIGQIFKPSIFVINHCKKESNLMEETEFLILSKGHWPKLKVLSQSKHYLIWRI